MSLTVDGMSCDHCIASITKAVAAVPGVTGVRVDLQANAVTIDGDAERSRVVDAIEECGYDVHRAA